MKLAKYLETHQVTIRALADRSGVARTTLHQIATNRHKNAPRLDHALCIRDATAGAVSLEDMLGEESIYQGAG